MGKRKRDDEVEESDQGGSVKQGRIDHKLKLGATKLGHAFKVAKGFERQKLGRRRKNAVAQGTQKDVDRIDAEVGALKALDTSSHARQHLHKSLMKIKAIAEHFDLPEYVKKPIELPTDAATLNVNARLCKSNPVKDALESAINEIQASLGIKSDRTSVKKKRRLRAKDFDDLGADDASLPSKGHRSHKNSIQSPIETAIRSGPELGDDVSEDDLATYNDHLASSSDDAPDEEADVDELERQLASEGVKHKPSRSKKDGYSLEADLSISGSESEPRSTSPEPQKASMTTKSSYLPSLTMGGYISGSGSDLEDDVDVAPRKKNLKGQRERRKIWEQKYGSRANHLQKQARNEGWDPKRGATARGGGRGREGKHPARRSGPDYNVGGMNGGPRTTTDKGEKKKSRDDTGPIHPSWEAAKRAKEQKQKKEAPVAFQGKKTVFD